MNKKKVLLAGNSEMVIFRFRKELVEQLVEEGHEVYVSFPQSQFGDGYTTAEKMGCHYIDTPISSHGTNPVTDLKLMQNYKKILRQIRPDMMFTYTIKPNIYGGMAAASCGVPCVMNVSGLGTAVENPGPLQFVTLMLYRLATRKAQKVFFQNTENQEFFRKHGIALDKQGLLPGSGVNTSQYHVLPYPHDEQVNFLFMARILKEKGIDQYTEAARIIRQKHPEAVFHVLGVCDDAEYQKKLDGLTREGVIQYHGQQKDLLPYQMQSSCTIHPTYYPEGMSNVLLESAACGRPLITTDRSGCREIIDDDVNGFICKQKDTQDLVKQIEKFLALSWEQRRDMGLAGRTKIEREFDRQIVVDAYLNELNQTEK